MSYGFCAKVKPLLMEKKYDNIRDKFCDFLQPYKTKDWVYPTAISRNIRYDIKNVYEILEILTQNKLLRQYLCVACPECHKYIGKYKTVRELPEYMECQHCNCEFDNIIKHTYIIYRVL